MTSRHLKAAAATCAGLALSLAGCATKAPRPAPARVEAPVGRVEAQAMAFESFMRKARAIDPGFSSAGDVSAALQVGASHEPHQLEAGMVAYAAMAALQEPGFVTGVQRAARGGDLARRLATDPAAVLDLPGGEAAAARAGAALARQGEGLGDVGQRVKRAAYSVQRQGWSKSKVSDPRGRLAQVKRLSAAGYQPAPGDAARMRAAVAAAGRRGGSASPVVARGVALAALSVLGEAERGRPLMSEPRTASCLRLAKLNLYQCLASAGPQYEDIYCLGQHAMIDPGQCVADAAHPPAKRSPITRASWTR
ncbi:hypothetical protein LJR225_002259 [Phenylobacterium sp. LjRoot225]|uniref:hypothetical protein n=1 Tax=Phenylobacterium sp. LjRoot225 TaxID=3342285 RepID=UPI003ED065FD